MSSFTPVRVAAAGSSQATATRLSATFSLVTSIQNGTGVMIAPITGDLQIIFNDSSGPIEVWPLGNMALVPRAINQPIRIEKFESIGVIVESPTRAYVVLSTSSFG